MGRGDTIIIVAAITIGFGFIRGVGNARMVNSTQALDDRLLDEDGRIWAERWDPLTRLGVDGFRR